MAETTRSPMRTVRDWLAGKPLAHPLHPILVHLPIGLFTLSVLFDLANRLFMAENWLVRGSFYMLVFALGVALLAALTGLNDWADIRDDHPGKKIATTHMVLNLVAVALFAVSAGLRYGQLDVVQVPLFPLLLSLAGMGLLGYSGYLGGRLIYEDGVSVGRHRRPGDLPSETVQIAPSDSREEFVTVAYANRLAEGQTLRVDANGHVMTLARHDGELFAFQEFCTHRFGPLSEGKLQDGQVECPWHRSCFDMRTGQVTQGPAKVELKTYDVRVVDDVIQVRVPAGQPQARAAQEDATASR
jgi:nitrite reductase/ring-hydroxylating ferredoxin subunit/uncharacterized membrane protein